MAEISCPGGFIPSTKDTPLDLRSRINTISEITSIVRPCTGMIVYVADEKDYYKITRVSSLGKVREYEKLIEETGSKLIVNELFTAQLEAFPSDLEIRITNPELLSEEETDIFLNFDKNVVDELADHPQYQNYSIYTSDEKLICWKDDEDRSGISIIEIKNLLDSNPDTILCLMGIGSSYITVSVYD